MGWGNVFTSEISFNKETYSNLADVVHAKVVNDAVIVKCETKLKMFAVATPNNVVIDLSDDIISSIDSTVDEILEIYNVALIKRYKLDLYIDYLNMISNDNNRNVISEHLDDENLLFADGFDSAIIGVIESKSSNNNIVAYSKKRCIEILINGDGLNYEQATEFFEFNVTGAYVGEKAPIFIDDLILE